MKIGEFAKRSGVTVKTLLHYDKIRLLQPSLRTESGYRIYCDEDFIKLQQITTQQLIDIIKITNMEARAKHRFDNACKQYVTDSYYWRAKTEELINELIRPNMDDVVLDLGCGTGKQIVELSSKVKLAIGVDISEGMLKQAKENIEKESMNNIELYMGTFEEPNLNVDLNKKGITKIISNYALHHLTTVYKQKAIEEMIKLGGESLQSIIIGDLMFFENPDDYKEEFPLVGYGPKVDFPSNVEEIAGCFSNHNFTIEVHRLHPLVGVIAAYRNQI